MSRRLAAVLMADVVGFSRLMEADEAGTLAALKQRRKLVLEPCVKEHSGRIVKYLGDGVLIEFASAIDAVSCALSLQNRMADVNRSASENRPITLRIGVNMGDLIEDGGDIYGDTVNVAARIEPLAEPGCICASGKVVDEIGAKIQCSRRDLGEIPLKNIERPVRVYQLAAADFPDGDQPRLPLPDKPSIAVLPFQNISGDPEQDYFADGMVEDIITGLSRANWLFVIARNSTFTYKGRSVDVKRVGRELGVHYVLEGSVRRAGNRVRITAQLIDAPTGAHLWADTFNGSIDDVFELQDQVTARVLGALAPKLEEAEFERIKRKPTSDLNAYDCFIRGMAFYNRWTKEASEQALPYFYKAIELDPDYAAPYGMAARCFVQRKASSFHENQEADIAETERLARLAGSLGKDDPAALAAAGFALAYVVGDVEVGDAYLDRSLALNPNSTVAWIQSGWAKAWMGVTDQAIERERRAMSLSPQDHYLFSMQAATGLACLLAGDFPEGIRWGDAAHIEQPLFIPAYCIMAASAANAGDIKRATEAMRKLLAIRPGLRLADLRDHYFLRNPEQRERWREGLRMAIAGV